MRVHYNNAIICNDQNDAFSEALIDIYNLQVSNPKGHVNSWPLGQY
jgi:hypothetical protein